MEKVASATSLVRLAFTSISVVFFLATLLYGGLIGWRNSADRAASELSLTMDAAELILTNELFSGNLILAKERVQTLLRSRSAHQFCLTISDVAALTEIFSNASANDCTTLPFHLKRTIYFDKERTQPAYLMSAGVAPEAFIKTIPPVAWAVFIGMILLTMALNIYYQRRLQGFLLAVRETLTPSDSPSSLRNSRDRNYEEIASISDLVTQVKDATREKAVARTARNLSHDLKNPLGTFEVALHTKNAAELQEWRPSMTRSLDAIRSILSDMGKDPASRVAIRPTETTLDLATIVSDLQGILQSHGATIEAATSEILHVFLDPVAIERAIANLVRNAVEAGAKLVVISVEVRDPDLFITVVDNGPGLPRNVADNLGERGLTEGKIGGQGIGLFNVKAIAEAHRGAFDYKRIGDRSSFKLTLPGVVRVAPLADQNKFSPSVTAEVSTRPLSSGYVLISLNDRKLQEMIVSEVRRQGIKVESIAKPGYNPLLVYTDVPEVVDIFLEADVVMVDHSEGKAADKAIAQIVQLHTLHAGAK